MASPGKNIYDIQDQLAAEISADVGNQQEDELMLISDDFNKHLSTALGSFKSSTFDNNGFVQRLRSLNSGNKDDKEVINNVLNQIQHEYIDVQSVNHSELLMRRDMFNICTQMPEMRDVVWIVRDAIIECNIASGEVSRTLQFENHDEEKYMTQITDIEEKNELLMHIKNHIVPRTLMIGELYIHVVPYAKLFAEIQAVREFKHDKGVMNPMSGFRESFGYDFELSKSIYSDDNLKVLKEAVSSGTALDAKDTLVTDGQIKPSTQTNKINENHLKFLLENINVSHGSSPLLEELGPEGFADLVMTEYKKTQKKSKESHFTESMNAYMKGVSSYTETMRRNSQEILGVIPHDKINYNEFSHIKGSYIKYLDSMRMVPIRMDRKIIGYYYISTTMDLQVNPAQPNGIVDLSFQHYTRDKNLIDNLASIIIKSFDKKMLERNVKLKSEIAEIIMAHRFSEGRLSFIYIPENEVIRMVINEDENGKGHSILEPALFPARMYLMLSMYNMIYTLNNVTTRVHYIKSSGLNKDYISQIQRTMRKFQSRRITIDDIYSFHGVLNKVGGMGEMVMPAGRGDYKAIETDTIPAVEFHAVSVEFLEQTRRQAVSGTGVPYLMATNVIDEVDFATTMKMANTRFLSLTSAYKMDMNRGLTKFYQTLLHYNTDMEEDVIQSFKFKFNPARQQELNITTEMLNNFNAVVDAVASFYYNPEELQDKEGKPTPKMKILRKHLAKKYLPQFDFDDLDEIIAQVDLETTDEKLQGVAKEAQIEKDDLQQVEGEEG